MPRPKNMSPSEAKALFKKEYQLQLKRGDEKGQLLRQTARRAYDKAGISRKGLDIDHKKPIRSGGTSNKSNLRLRSRKSNRGDNGHNPGE